MTSLWFKIRYYSAILLDRQTPWYVKGILAIGLIYLVWPLDLVPDGLPVVGWLDDLTISTLLVALALRLVPTEVTARISQRLSGNSGVAS